MLIITDDELLEGLIGGIGWLLAVFYLRNGFYKYKLNGTNLALIGIVAWCFWWYIRKIGLNLYREYKKTKNESTKKIEIKGITNKPLFILLFILIFAIIFYLFIIQFCSKSTQIAMKISNLEIPLILFILFSVGLIFYSK